MGSASSQVSAESSVFIRSASSQHVEGSVWDDYRSDDYVYKHQGINKRQVGIMLHIIINVSDQCVHLWFNLWLLKIGPIIDFVT